MKNYQNTPNQLTSFMISYLFIQQQKKKEICRLRRRCKRAERVTKPCTFPLTDIQNTGSLNIDSMMTVGAWRPVRLPPVISCDKQWECVELHGLGKLASKSRCSSRRIVSLITSLFLQSGALILMACGCGSLPLLAIHPHKSPFSPATSDTLVPPDLPFVF